VFFVESHAFVQMRALWDFAAAFEIPGLRAVDEFADFGSVDEQSPIFSPRKRVALADKGICCG